MPPTGHWTGVLNYWKILYNVIFYVDYDKRVYLAILASADHFFCEKLIFRCTDFFGNRQYFFLDTLNFAKISLQYVISVCLFDKTV